MLLSVMIKDPSPTGILHFFLFPLVEHLIAFFSVPNMLLWYVFNQRE